MSFHFSTYLHVVFAIFAYLRKAAFSPGLQSFYGVNHRSCARAILLAAQGGGYAQEKLKANDIAFEVR